MRGIIRFVAVASCFLCTMALAGEGARIEVATLDGAPVYHWRAFQSCVLDDVDRALILREFRRKLFKLPPKMVDEAVQGTINKDFGGDAKKFAQSLRTKGASEEEYKRFISEEITLQAMIHQDDKDPAEQKRKQTAWLAGLRADASVKRVPARGSSN